MAPEDIKEYKPYDPIEIDLLNSATNNIITCQGHFIRYTKKDKVLIYVHGIIMNVHINRISKVWNES